MKLVLVGILTLSIWWFYCFYSCGTALDFHQTFPFL